MKVSAARGKGKGGGPFGYLTRKLIAHEPDISKDSDAHKSPSLKNQREACNAGQRKRWAPYRVNSIPANSGRGPSKEGHPARMRYSEGGRQLPPKVGIGVWAKREK